MIGLRNIAKGNDFSVAALVLFACGVYSETPERPDQRIEIEVTRLTSGPDHHLFGYIGQSLTIPWNASGRYVVALEVPFHDRLPEAREAARVVLIDTHEGNCIRSLDTTRGWNLQQGTMLYWHPANAETRFFFNDRDPESGRVFTVLYDVEENRRVQEYRFSDYSIANGGVSPTGEYYAAINYGRMDRLRPVTGYAGALDPSAGELAPVSDGLFKVDTKTGAVALLASFRELRELLAVSPGWVLDGKRWTPASPESGEGERPDVSQAELYINHTLVSRDGKRIYFFVRGKKGRRNLWLDAACSIRADGSGLTLHPISIGGHPEWATGSLMIGAHEGRQVLYDVEAKTLLSHPHLNNAEAFPDPEGDIALSYDGDWLVNGYTSEDRQRIRYTIMRLADGAYAKSDWFDRGPYTKGNLRTDPAPRWNRDSNALLVPGWAEDGTRQLYVLHVRKEQ